jgi:hypothetical protein
MTGRTVADLDATDILVWTTHNGQEQVVHRRPDMCRRLDRDRVGGLRVGYARAAFDDWRVCSFCDPSAEDPRDVAADGTPAGPDPDAGCACSTQRSVDDLDAGRVVVWSSRSGGGQATVHLRADECYEFVAGEVNHLRVAFAGDVFDDWLICTHCDPGADETAFGSDGTSTVAEELRPSTLKREDVGPEDYGLDPLPSAEGER